MGLEYVRQTIRDNEMPDTELGSGWLHVSQVSENADDEFGEGGVALRSLGLLNAFGANVERWPASRVRGRLRNERYFHAVHYPRAFHIHPLNYMNGLAQSAVALGARIFADTPAVSIDPAGVRKRIDTPGGRVRAAHIVLAVNVGLGRLSPVLAGTLFPLTSHVAVTAPIGPALAQTVDYAGAISDTNGANFHYRVVHGDRLMWGGGGAVWPAGRKRMAARLAKGIRDTYPQLPPVTVEHVWSGTMGFTLHRMPQIGEVTPGLWLASGFGGHGLNTTAMAGELIASAIVERDDRWRLFLPYELVWAGGTAGRVVAQSVFTWRQRREVIQAKLARRKEARQNAARVAAREAGAAARRVLGSSRRDPSGPSPPLSPPLA
jgi:glycine/D-amino acid oxidase-like deaminating enzyme